MKISLRLEIVKEDGSVNSKLSKYVQSEVQGEPNEAIFRNSHSEDFSHLCISLYHATSYLAPAQIHFRTELCA